MATEILSPTEQSFVDGEAYYITSKKFYNFRGTYIFFKSQEKFKKLNGLAISETMLSLEFVLELTKNSDLKIHLLK